MATLPARSPSGVKRTTRWCDDRQADFDDWPERYDRWFETPLGKAVLATERELILDMLQPREGELILDAGSGTGIFTGAFLARGADVMGLDISFAMLRRGAKKNAALAGRGVAADMIHLPFGDDPSTRASPSRPSNSFRDGNRPSLSFSGLQNGAGSYRGDAQQPEPLGRPAAGGRPA